MRILAGEQMDAGTQIAIAAIVFPALTVATRTIAKALHDISELKNDVVALQLNLDRKRSQITQIQRKITILQRDLGQDPDTFIND